MTTIAKLLALALAGAAMPTVAAPLDEAGRAAAVAGAGGVAGVEFLLAPRRRAGREGAGEPVAPVQVMALAAGHAGRDGRPRGEQGVGRGAGAKREKAAWGGRRTVRRWRNSVRALGDAGDRCSDC